MKYLSVCSGIESASIAWEPLGWVPAGFSEIEPFPSAVLATRWPKVRNYGDMTKYENWKQEIGTIDLLVGGTPCQSFSVAGLRKGLHDPRGGLMLTFLEIAQCFKPRWVVWENVPGVLSSHGGRDFGSFLGALGDLGYGWSYRVLDAQWFGLAQRRRRVFVVGCLGDWTCAGKVLFESESVCRDTPPSRETRKDAPSDIEGSTRSRCKNLVFGLTSFAGYKQGEFSTITRHGGDLGGGSENLITAIPIHDQATRHSGRRGNKQDGKGNGLGIGKPGDPAHTLTRGDKHAVAMRESGQGYWMEDEKAGTLRAEGENRPSRPSHVIAQTMAFPIDTQNMTEGHASGGKGFGGSNDPSFTLTKGHSHAVAVDTYNHAIQDKAIPIRSTASDVCHTGGVIDKRRRMAVRRLTPKECERLQGFPDDYTLIPWRGKTSDQCPDGPRYKALGNSMAVNCMRWIGERINKVHKKIS